MSSTVQRGVEMSTMRSLFAPLAVMMLLTTASPPGAADTVRIGGTGGALGVLRSLGWAFSAATGETLTVVPGLGSAGGIRAVAAGVLDIGVASRPIRANEPGKGLATVLVARSPYGFVSSLRKPDGLRSAGIAAIYAARSPVWSNGTPIRIILRPRADSDTDMLVEYFPGMGTALEQARSRPDVPVAPTDQDNAEMAEQIAGSLTAAPLAQILAEGRNLRFASIDGVEPTLDNFEKGTYPYIWPMYFIFPEAKTPAAEHFLAFVRSPEGERVLHDAGCLPARE
jgi:phosphate transport system substrate-binding protein